MVLRRHFETRKSRV